MGKQRRINNHHWGKVLSSVIARLLRRNRSLRVSLERSKLQVRK
jgi:hypothetical protein